MLLKSPMKPGTAEDPKSPRPSEVGEASGTRQVKLYSVLGAQGSACRHLLIESIGCFLMGLSPHSRPGMLTGSGTRA